MKERKAFGKWDIIIYTLSALTVFALFLFFVILPSSAKSDGFKIVIGDTEVFTFRYSDQVYTVKDGFDITVDTDGDFYTITVKTENGFNLIRADANEKSVRVLDADCSVGKDCAHSLPLSGDTGAIICVPHDLRVLPLKGGFTPPIAG